MSTFKYDTNGAVVVHINDCEFQHSSDTWQISDKPDLSEFVWICPICFQFVWTDQTQPIQPYNNKYDIY